jgi:tetratricopeptide (TPR) repeat protein
VAGHYVALLAHSCGNLRQAVSQFHDAANYAHRAFVDVLQIGLLFNTAVTWVLALDLHLLGRVDEALQAFENGLRYARESKHLFSLSFALCFPWLRHFRREPEIVLARAMEAISLCEENGFAVWLGWARFSHGWAFAELGKPEDGVAEMEGAIANFRRMGGVPNLPYAIALVGSAYARMAHTEKALELLDEALAGTDQGEKIEQAEILRLKGEVLLLVRDPSTTVTAEKCFRKSLDVACAQEAKWWELRTTVSLARLLRDTNRLDEAHTMLSDIYNWFTEGSDLPDLKDAKTLLDELSAVE